MADGIEVAQGGGGIMRGLALPQADELRERVVV